MDETFDSTYIKDKHYFGTEADLLLKKYYNLLEKNSDILDIGIGQGRNALFLLKQGFKLVGIDTSIVAIEALKKLVYKEKLNLKLHNTNFIDFKTKENQFAGIIIFGLFQILSEKEIKELSKQIKYWLKKNGLVYIKGFTKKDESFKPKSLKWKKISEITYADNNDNYRSFLNIENIIKYFKQFEVIYKWTGFGEKHRHTDGPLEQHHYFEIILQKR